MNQRVAYLVNQYPKVSHSFIRREISALEKAGLTIDRYAMRGWDAEVVDPLDAEEISRTHYLLQNKHHLLRDGAWALLTRPGRLYAALRQAIAMGRRADRPLALHLVYLLEACSLARHLEHRAVRHVHAHFGTNGTSVALLACMLGDSSYSFTVHGPEEFDKPEFIHLGDKIRRSKFVVAITSYCRSQLYRWVEQKHWAKVQVVHCGLDHAFHTGHQSPVPDTPKFVCIGRLCEQKGQLLLVQAVASLVAAGENIHLTLAGDGEHRAPIEALIQQHQLHRHITITGWVSSTQVRDLLLASRAMVLPSFAEGLPVVIMEAMALQRPVITTSIAGIPELVAHAKTGWLVIPGSVESLIQAMREALHSTPAALAEMGRQGRAAVLQAHDIELEAAKLAEHFKRTLSPA